MKKTLVHTPKRRLGLKSLSVRTRLISAAALLVLTAALGLTAARPAHTAGGPIPVTVSNAPLTTTAADDPAKQPFQVSRYISVNGTSTDFGTVPAGKRLVIESVTAFSDLVNDPHSHSIILIPTSSSFDGYQDIDLLATSSPYHAVTQKVLTYAEAGQTPYVFVQTTGGSNPEIYITLSGHYVDVP